MLRFRVAVALCCLLLCAVPVFAQDQLPRVEPAQCWMQVSPDAGLTEGTDYECGYLFVPENRSNPQSATIQLAYAILHTSSDQPQPDPIIYLTGGPGANAVGELDAWVGIPYIENRDLILLDQRGTGYSKPTLNCPEVENGEDDATQKCHDRLVKAGVNLDAYNSAENAADVADLRLALGYDEWNLYGISYGTRLALTVMRDHPEGVRSVMIDSVYPPEVNSWEEYGQNTADMFDALFNACARDSACNAAYPNLKTVFFATADKLNASPADYRGTNADTGDAEDKTLSGTDWIDRVFQVMYDTASLPYLPQVIYEVANGNYKALDQLEAGETPEPGAHFQRQSEDVTDSEGMNLSVECQEEVAFNNEDTALANVPAVPAALHDDSVQTIQQTFDDCATWNVKQAPAKENEPVVSAIPTLVMAGEFDPITPAKWAKSAASHLTNSHYFLVPGAGHGVIDTGDCPTSIAVAFLKDPTADLSGSCLQDLPGIEFVVP